MPTIQRIAPCLWFDGRAEEAATFYTAIFKNSRIGTISRFGEAGREIHGQAPGSVMAVAFELDGQSFTALNGGPLFQFTEAISFQVNCDTQAEVDYYWESSTGRRPESPAVRLAQGQVRRVVAGRANNPPHADWRCGHGQVGAGHDRSPSDEEVRDRRDSAGL